MVEMRDDVDGRGDGRNPRGAKKTKNKRLSALHNSCVGAYKIDRHIRRKAD